MVEALARAADVAMIGFDSQGPRLWLIALVTALALVTIAALGGCAPVRPRWPECDHSPGAYVQAAPGVGRTCRP